MNVSFLGAAETVTGSCHLVESGNTKFLIDCGMFQGLDMESRNRLDFKFDPSEIDFVILTHAHLDHCGLLPKLTKHGFAGKIYMTPPTSEIVELILKDSAKIQEGNARYAKKQFGLGDERATSIYDTVDSLNTIAKFESVRFNSEKEIAPGIRFKLIRAGHILGAASVLIEVEGKLIVFSGDIGRDDQSLIKKFQLDEWSFDNNKNSIDMIVMESLYSGLEHPDRNISEEKLVDIINKTHKRDGNVMIPVFSLHRLQQVEEILENSINKGGISQDVQIFSDTPLGNKATLVYTSNRSELNEEFRQSISKNKNNNNQERYYGNIRIIRHHRESLGLLKKKNAIIMAGSGMAAGGRIVSHLHAGLKSSSNSVIFVGFQAEGTLGRKLVDGSSEVEIFKHKIKINAEIYYLKGFSAHADNDDLLMWLDSIPKKMSTKIFLVHAELERSNLFKTILADRDIDAIVPKWNETITV